ncbi:hypothetical protein AAG906_020371 [Vitis piasezkii]
MGQGYEDHLVTQRRYPRAYKTCFKFWTRAKGLYTNDIQRLYKFFMVLTLIGLRPDLELIRDRFLVVHRFTSSPPIWPILDSLLPRPPSSSASRTSQASIASVVQLIRASDHLSGNKDLFSSITTTSIYLIITLANGSQTVAKGIGTEYGKTIGIGRESQGLYHLTSIHLLQVCISTDAPLLIHNRLGHPSLSKFRRWFLVFHFVAACEQAFRQSHEVPLLGIFQTSEGLAHSHCLPRCYTPRPLQVYHRRPRVVAPLPFAKAPADSLPIPSASPAPALPSTDDLPIAIRKAPMKLFPIQLATAMVDEMAALLYSSLWFDYGDTFSLLPRLLRPLASLHGCYVFLEVCFRHLEETGMLDQKPVDTPMDPNVKLVPGQGEPLGDPGRYRRLVGKLNYLTITRPDISFPVSVVSQFLQSPCDSHWDAVIRILRYIKSTPGQGVLYENRGHTQVVGYTDADWAGSPTDRRSTCGCF